MKEYLDLLQDVLENGNDRGDRTGTGTRSIFGRMVKFDLNKGFPIVTTKRVPFKSLTAELLWFLKGNTNNNVLNEMGSTIWDEWQLKHSDIFYTHEERKNKFVTNDESKEEMENYVQERINNDPDMSAERVENIWMNQAGIPKNRTNFNLGDLGPIYSAMWRRVPVNSDDIIFVDIRNGPPKGPVELPERIRKLKRVESEYKGDLPIQWENNGSPFRIIREVSVTGDKNSSYLIQFDDNNYMTKVSRTSLKVNNLRGIVYNPYKATVSGVGCNGVPTIRPNDKLYEIWNNMLARCYRPHHPIFSTYGGKGVYVSPRWLCFENFFNDIKQLPNYENWCKYPGEYDLDKDYYGSNCYDVSTCLFLKKSINISQTNTKLLKAISPEGDISQHYGQEALCSFLKVDLETLRLYRLSKLKRCVLNGWHFEEVTPPEGKLIRKRVYVDQLQEVLDALRNKPNSRRLIVSAWVPEFLPDETKSPEQNILDGKMALAPCHCFFHFYVSEMKYVERVKWAKDNNMLDIQNNSSRNGVDTDYVFDDSVVPKNKLSCMVYVRSNDAFLGCPFNIASYALLVHLVAREVNMGVGELVYNVGDFHIYRNHMEQVKELLTRTPKSLPVLKIAGTGKSIFQLGVEDISLEGYDPYPTISAPVAK